MRYIGSKRELLSAIDAVVHKHATGNEETFLDLFAGTNVVGNHFKKQFTVYSNDLLYFSYVNAMATIENNGILRFDGLQAKGIHDPLAYLNAGPSTAGSPGYYERAYSPATGAMYFTEENGRRIDFIRDSIDQWNTEGLLSSYEYYYLVSTLIEAIPSISNITGTYGAYLKHWDKRALDTLHLKPLPIVDNNRANRAYNTNANELVEEISADIAYIDTPYNNRQYASNYHVLENIARNNKPDLHGKTRVFDWFDLKSEYAMKKTAYTAMGGLLETVKARHIIISYNNEGIIPLPDLVALAQENSIQHEVEVEIIPYRKYISKVRPSTRGVEEVLIYMRKDAKGSSRAIIPIDATVWKAKTETEPGPHLIKSPLNYIGGKYSLLNQLLPLFPERINTFVDLFSGGANVGINAFAQHYVMNDMNDRINDIFRYIISNNIDLCIDEINSYINNYSLSKTNEQGYLALRREYNRKPNPIMLYTLIAYSYNYQARFNNNMEFNNPFGRDRSHFSQSMEERLRAFVKRCSMLDIRFTDSMFEDYPYEDLTQDDFVYMDPPYLITTGNYNDGNRGFRNWGESEERKLYGVMDMLSARGIRFALSNVLMHKGKDNALLRQYIDEHDVNVHHLNKTYKNSSHNTLRKNSDEVLITNY